MRPLPIRLDKTWKATIKRMSVPGGKVHAAPRSTLYGLLSFPDLPNPVLRAQTHATEELANRKADMIHAQRAKTQGALAIRPAVVTILLPSSS